MADPLPADPTSLAPAPADASPADASPADASPAAGALVVAVKALIVRALMLEGVAPADIEDEGRLFGEGLGLDSVDALELAIHIEEQFGVRMPEDDRAKEAFRTAGSIARFIQAHRPGGAA